MTPFKYQRGDRVRCTMGKHGWLDILELRTTRPQHRVISLPGLNNEENRTEVGQFYICDSYTDRNLELKKEYVEGNFKLHA